MNTKLTSVLSAMTLSVMLLSGCNGGEGKGTREAPKEGASPTGATPMETATGSTGEGGTDLKVTLSANEIVPAPGDGDLSGSGTVRIDTDDGLACPNLNIPMPDTDITAAHIHRGEAGVNGPAVVTFGIDPGDVKDDCITADKVLLNEMEEQPGNFYVDVHTEEFPDGAIRGQLNR